MALEQIDDPEVAAKFKADPRLYVRNFWNHPTRTDSRYDFRTTEGEPLGYMVHDAGPLNPEMWADVNILLMARGGLKSTMTRMLFNWAHDLYPSFDSYFVAPTKRGIHNWMSSFRKNIEESGLTDRRVVNNKTYQKFKVQRERDGGGTYPVIGEFQTDSGYTEESVRGPHSNGGLIDEAQDLKKEVFDAYLPAVDAKHPEIPQAPFIWMIGTPKETGTFFHRLYDEYAEVLSWDNDRGTYVRESEGNPYMVAQEEVSELDIDIDDVEPKTVRAWHLDWPNSPKHDDAQIVQAKATLGEMRFTNEILARFYDPEDNLLSPSQVQAVCDPDMGFNESRVSDESTVVVAVDWGGGKDKNASDTVIGAFEQMDYEDHTHTVLRDFLFADDDLTNREQIRLVEDWIVRYDPEQVIVDYGFGEQAMESLQNGDDTRSPDGYEQVVACHYGHVTDKASLKWETSSGDQKFFTADKTHNTSQMVDWIRDGQVTIPAADMGTGNTARSRSRLINHLTSAYRVLSETSTGQKKVKIETPESANDDALDMFTFGWIGLNKVAANDPVLQVGMSKRGGY